MYDVIVIGGGPAGLSAALMLGRCRRRSCSATSGSRETGVPRRSTDISRATGFRHRLQRTGTRRTAALRHRDAPVGVTGAQRDEGGDRYRVALADGSEEEARFILIATGVIDDLPAIAGFDECYGRSLFHCPYCDGWEWRDRRIAVFGRARPECRLALGLKTWSADVVVCTTAAVSIAPARTCRAERRRGLHETNRAARATDGALTSVVFASGDPLPRDVMFFTTGQHPQSDLATKLGCTLTRAAP